MPGTCTSLSWLGLAHPDRAHDFLQRILDQHVRFKQATFLFDQRKHSRPSNYFAAGVAVSLVVEAACTSAALSVVVAAAGALAALPPTLNRGISPFM